jgi:CO/xanthine dehydrogenase Mo-binding subunit
MMLVRGCTTALAARCRRGVATSGSLSGAKGRRRAAAATVTIGAIGHQLSDDGRQLNPYLLDYKLQTCADVPGIRVAFVDAPAPNAGPKGLKGLAEPPCIPTPGAIANAIAAATGVAVQRLPMTAERLWSALDTSSRDGGA